MDTPRLIKVRAAHGRGSSKVSRRLAILRGVFVAERETGVFHGFCAGLGVILTKSAKSNPCPGVLGNKLPPPGVVMWDEGSPKSRLIFVGGVDGGSILVRVDGMAGEGEAAR